jgi:hypothetical protein
VGPHVIVNPATIAEGMTTEDGIDPDGPVAASRTPSNTAVRVVPFSIPDSQ